MTSVNFQQWIQHPETLDRDTLYELRNMLARYPYFQSLRLLYLKNLYILHDINFGAELRKAVLYIADRRKLFQLIEGDRFAVQSRKKGVPLTEVLKNEPSVDRTLALIDAFLSTVPEAKTEIISEGSARLSDAGMPIAYVLRHILLTLSMPLNPILTAFGLTA